MEWVRAKREFCEKKRKRRQKGDLTCLSPPLGVVREGGLKYRFTCFSTDADLSEKE